MVLLGPAVFEDVEADHSISSMADSIGVSGRHLNRLFRTEGATTPAKWVESVRVDASRTSWRPCLDP